jgi:hypothetical protein
MNRSLVFNMFCWRIQQKIYARVEHKISKYIALSWGDHEEIVLHKPSNWNMPYDSLADANESFSSLIPLSV